MPRLTEEQVLEAVRCNDIETLRRHLDCGGDPNLRGGNGQMTLLQIAAQCGHMETVSELSRRKDCRKNERSSRNGDTALIIAVKRGHALASRHLILCGDCDLNAQNNEGFTALMKAAKRGMGSIMLLLMQHGADLEVTSSRGGHTALTLAVANQKPKAVELLLQFGASLEHTTSDGSTPVDIVWDLKCEGSGESDDSKRQDIFEKLTMTKNHRADIKRDTGLPTDVLNGQYKIVATIGSGTFGSVFLTDNLRSHGTNGKVVVKAMKPRSNRRTAEIESDGLHEAKLMLMMDNPMVVQIIQYFKVGKSFCIAMEYCEFGDMDCWIQALGNKHRQFPTETVMHWLLQLLLALNYLHSNGILHRDMKPKNIFLKQDATAKIGDFGLSRRLLGTGDYASTVAGTVAYMCPEILRNVNKPAICIADMPAEVYDTKCDIWSIGCILYELCTCKLLFDVDNIKEMVCGDCELPHLPDRYPGELNSLFDQMMVRQRKARASCEQLLSSRLVREKLSSMMEHGCASDLKFLQDNCHLLKVGDHLTASVDTDQDTLTSQGGGNDRLWQAVDSVLKKRAPNPIGPNYNLQDDSISDTVPDSIIQALAERVKWSGFPLEQIYRLSLVNLDSPPGVRRADYAKYTDDIEACEEIEALVVCEMTKK